ncbi:MAG: hypothetical protein JWM35_87 [Verrucomicrobia bacterium]|nr:hypothetical protein [Verrucomicrobiota bacterium]
MALPQLSEEEIRTWSRSQKDQRWLQRGLAKSGIAGIANSVINVVLS